MIEDQLDEVAAAHGTEQERLIRELAGRPEDVLPVAIDALTRPPQSRWDAAVRLIRRMGYPRNELAIPTLIHHLGDPNWLGWAETIRTLEDIGSDVVIPYLIQVLWDKGRTNKYWADDVEGICAMLCQVDVEYAKGCGPVISHLLTSQGKDIEPDASWLLDVLERIGPDNAQYALPALIEFNSSTTITDEQEQARRLIASFDRKVLSDYNRILDSNLQSRQ